jgi:predicted nuclease of predicted toxin-antitoxin system
MKFLIDMNLSPRWCDVLRQHGWEAVHWSHVGDHRAADRTIMDWARAHGYVVLTHDLDFGILLALTNAGGPSVVQSRTQDLSPEHLGAQLVSVLRNHAAEIEAGALVTVDEIRARVRILPIDERH